MTSRVEKEVQAAVNGASIERNGTKRKKLDSREVDTLAGDATQR